MKHKHAELIKIWLEDITTEFQWYYEAKNLWYDVTKGMPPSWDDTVQYRVKPKPFNPGIFKPVDSLNSMAHDNIYYIESNDFIVCIEPRYTESDPIKCGKYIMEKVNET